VDREDQADRVADFAALGIDEPVAVSAAHGLGIEELWARIDAALGRAGEGVEEAAGEGAAEAGEAGGGGAAAGEGREEGEVAAGARADLPPRVALIGRPNVGKSSLLNRLVGFERALVDSVPGTTRDAIDVAIERGGRRYVIVDTAGLRRPSRIVETIEGYAAAASLRAIERCEVAVLVLDATLGVSDQDMRLADLVWRRGRGFVVAVNKVDLAPALAAEQCHDTIAKRLPQWPPVPLVRVSALTGAGLRQLFGAVDTVVQAYRRRIPTARLNEVVRAAVEAHPPPLVRGKPPKILYAAQVRSSPQEIALVAGHPEGLSTEYRRYLLHHVREAFGLVGVPVKLDARERTRPPRGRRGGPATGEPSAARAALAKPTASRSRPRPGAAGEGRRAAGGAKPPRRGRGGAAPAKRRGKPLARGRGRR
jgi:GTP-binding protein